MLKTLDQAQAIQARRLAAGRFGYAKAVLRFLRRRHSDRYQALRAALPMSPRPKQPARDPRA